MKERFNLSLSGLWLFVTAVALILPVFLPSSVNPQNFLENVIGTVTVTMFILSFPSSLFGLPAMFFASYVLGVDPNTMGGMYLNLFMLCVLGYIQWFWIVPSVLRNEPRLQMLNLLGRNSELQLSEASPISNVNFCDSQGRTRLEKVFQEKDSDKEMRDQN
jgi:ascorbate-specific PTS system EIIC-type component UlaA